MWLAAWVAKALAICTSEATAVTPMTRPPEVTGTPAVPVAVPAWKQITF